MCDTEFMHAQHFFNRLEDMERATEVLKNLQSYWGASKRLEREVASKLEAVKAIPSEEKKGLFLITDPTDRFFSIVQVAPLTDYPAQRVYYIEMKPPIIPHFFLITSYISVKAGLFPATVVRVEPVLTLISLLVRGDKLTALASQLATGIALLENFVKGEVSIFPLSRRFLKMPVEAEGDALYLTNLGLATEPVSKGLTVKLDLGEIPHLPKEVFRKFPFKNAREVVDGIAGWLA